MTQKTCPITIAAFDFDGTITKHDALIFFLIYIYGYWKTSYQLILLLPFFIAYLLRRLSRQEIKEMILTRFFKGSAADKLSRQGKFFSKSSSLRKLMRREALKRIAWHQSQGHQCVLISAGIDLYLMPWGEDWDFQCVICSKLEIASDGTMTGRLHGLNCWGKEKVRRLEELFGPKKNYTLYAYGDSFGDQELLSIADYAFYKKMPFFDDSFDHG